MAASFLASRQALFRVLAPWPRNWTRCSRVFPGRFRLGQGPDFGQELRAHGQKLPGPVGLPGRLLPEKPDTPALEIHVAHFDGEQLGWARPDAGVQHHLQRPAQVGWGLFADGLDFVVGGQVRRPALFADFGPEPPEWVGGHQVVIVAPLAYGFAIRAVAVTGGAGQDSRGWK